MYNRNWTDFEDSTLSCKAAAMCWSRRRLLVQVQDNPFEDEVDGLVRVLRILGHALPPLPMPWIRLLAALQHFRLLLRRPILALKLVQQRPKVPDVRLQQQCPVEPAARLVYLQSPYAAQIIIVISTGCGPSPQQQTPPLFGRTLAMMIQIVSASGCRRTA